MTQSGPRRREPVDRAIAALATGQHGVVARAQLRELGLTKDDIRGRLERGALHPLHRGVYAVGHAAIGPDGRLHAALLACGPGAFLSHRTAAGFHGLGSLNIRKIDVTIVAARSPRRAGIVTHRTTRVLHRLDLTSRRGLLVATVPRLLVDLAPTLSEVQLTGLITQAVRAGVLAVDRLEAAIERSRRMPGIAKLSRASAAYRPRPDRRSALEHAFDVLLDAHPEVPEPLRNVRLLGWEVDYYWPEQRVVLELDGRPYHSAVADIERDRFKDAKLMASGIRPLRVTDRRFGDEPEGVLGDLLRLLERGADGAGPLAGAA